MERLLRKDSIKSRIIFSVIVLFIVGIITSVVSFSNTYDWVETDVSRLYNTLLTQDDRFLDSDKYLITDEYITRIEPNTTVEEFFSNISNDNFVLSYQGEIITEGIVKTGMVFGYGDESYTLVVAGDLNKDGLLTTTDISMMIDNAKSSEVYLLSKKAADFNEDGKLDKTDIDNSVDYIFNENIVLKEVLDVQLPSLEIVSGDLGDNNWYRDDVVVKIHNNGAKDTAYKVIGTNIQEGVGISDGTEVTLSGHGAYKVIAWNYGEDGNRSGITAMTFKIDDREIVPEITYSTTEITSEKVIAWISFNKENVFVSNNNRKSSYTFYENGDFEFEYIDVTGRTGMQYVNVDWLEDAVGADGEWRYSFINDDEIYLREYLVEVSETTNLVVPAEYDGYKVLGVGNNLDSNVFGRTNECVYDENCVVLKDLIISDGIEIIGDRAFTFTGKKEPGLIIPDTVTDIGVSAFANSEERFEGLYISGSLYLSESLKTISPNAFEYNEFKGEIVIPDSVVEIGSGAFSDSLYGATVTLGSGLKTIDSYAFSPNMINGDLIIPDNVTYVGTGAFYSSGDFDSLYISKSLTEISDSAFGYISIFGDVVIPDNVTSVDDYAFVSTSISGRFIFGDNVEYIGMMAFSNCNLTQNLILPDALKEIGLDAFTYNNFSGDLIIPDSVDTIGEYAFYESGFDGDLVIGDGITSLETIYDWGLDLYSFEGSLTIGDGVTEIPEHFFSNCNFSGTLTLGTGIKDIGLGAFAYSDFVGDLTIPNNVVTIGEHAFEGNKFNGTLTLGSGLKNIGEFSFINQKFVGDLVIPNNVEYFGEQAFSDITTMDDLIIGNGVTTIPRRAFIGSKFSSVTIGNKVDTICEEAFSGSFMSGDLIIPASVKTIEDSAFNNSGFDGTLIIEGTLNYLGTSSFSNNPNLKGTVDASKIESFDTSAFSNTGVNVINYEG